MTILGTLPVEGVLTSVMTDDVAWIGRGTNGHGSLERFDFSDPSDPVHLGGTPCVGMPYGLALAFGNAYSANWADDYAWVYKTPFVIFAGEQPGSPPSLGQLNISPF